MGHHGCSLPHVFLSKKLASRAEASGSGSLFEITWPLLLTKKSLSPIGFRSDFTVRNRFEHELIADD